MSFKLGLGSKKGIGIDIGSGCIKVLALAKSGHHKYRMENSDIAPLPGGAVAGGIISNEASIAPYLKSSFSRLGIKEKDVVIAVPCRHVIVKTVEMPKMKGDELDAAIYYEAQQYVTYNINDVFYDYVVLGESQTDLNNNMVMIIAGKKDAINNRTGFISECGLNPYAVDADCIAVENMFNFNYPEEFDRLVSLIMIGASETNVHVIQKGLNLFRRDIPIGGLNITDGIAKKFQMDFNEAENVKTGGIGKRDANFQTDYAIYLDMAASQIISEIQRAIDYFAANNNRQYPEKIYLTGGTSALPGLQKGIEGKLNIPAEAINPFRNILNASGTADNLRHLFGVAVGLSLRGFE